MYCVSVTFAVWLQGHKLDTNLETFKTEWAEEIPFTQTTWVRSDRYDWHQYKAVPAEGNVPWYEKTYLGITEWNVPLYNAREPTLISRKLKHALVSQNKRINVLWKESYPGITEGNVHYYRGGNLTWYHGRKHTLITRGKLTLVALNKIYPGIMKGNLP